MVSPLGSVAHGCLAGGRASCSSHARCGVAKRRRAKGSAELGQGSRRPPCACRGRSSRSGCGPSAFGGAARGSSGRGSRARGARVTRFEQKGDQARPRKPALAAAPKPRRRLPGPWGAGAGLPLLEAARRARWARLHGVLQSVAVVAGLRVVRVGHAPGGGAAGHSHGKGRDERATGPGPRSGGAAAGAAGAGERWRASDGEPSSEEQAERSRASRRAAGYLPSGQDHGRAPRRSRSAHRNAAPHSFGQTAADVTAPRAAIAWAATWAEGWNPARNPTAMPGAAGPGAAAAGQAQLPTTAASQLERNGVSREGRRQSDVL